VNDAQAGFRQQLGQPYRAWIECSMLERTADQDHRRPGSVAIVGDARSVLRSDQAHDDL
jgi:hypothetical protein